MQFVTGMIVRSRQGHDKGRFYIVLSVEGDTAYLFDAGKRPRTQPKKKKLMHLAPTKTVLSGEKLCSDSEIHKTLAEFQRKASLPKEVI